MDRPHREDDVLVTLGRRVREARRQRGLTLRALAAECGLSLRFLMDVEAGRGNISVRRLADLARALQTTVSALLSPEETVSTRVIALIGLRGAGKTTIGTRLARRLRLPFVELDREIERRAGLALAEIFSLHGEEYYRRLERDALAALFSTPKSMVLAVGGGLVTSPDTYDLLRRQARTIWLKARPNDYWTRVRRQGDRRPAETPRAREALRTLLARRAPLYARADLSVDTAGLTVSEAVNRVERALAPPR